MRTKNIKDIILGKGVGKGNNFRTNNWIHSLLSS